MVIVDAPLIMAIAALLTGMSSVIWAVRRRP
jgi:hypothetical protein